MGSPVGKVAVGEAGPPTLADRIQHQDARSMPRFPPLPRKKRSRSPSSSHPVVWALLTSILVGLGCYLIASGGSRSAPVTPPRRAFPRRNLVDARASSHNAFLAIRDLSSPSFHEILPPLRDLTANLSRAIENVDRLNLLLDGDLSLSIKRARDTGRCSQLPSIRSAVSLTQDHRDQVQDCLDLSTTLYEHALSRTTPAHAEAGRVLEANSIKSLWNQVKVAGQVWVSEAETKRKRAELRERRTVFYTLGNATDDLRDGKRLINLEVDRYARLRAGLDMLQQELAAASEAEEMVVTDVDVDRSCLVPIIMKLERLFVNVMSSTIEDGSEMSSVGDPAGGLGPRS